MTPGQKIHYKMMRTGLNVLPWNDLGHEMQSAYDSIAEQCPHLVPTSREIADRDAEMAEWAQTGTVTLPLVWVREIGS